MPTTLYRSMRLTAIIAGVYCVGAIAILGWPATGYLFALYVFWKLTRRKNKRVTQLGSARWAEIGDLKKAKMIGAQSGLILGRLPENDGTFRIFKLPKQKREDLVRLHQAVHTAIFAPTSAGKGVSIAIPALQTLEESMVVTDYKGELASLTAEHRRKVFGHRVVLLDPYRIVTAKPDSFNSMEFIGRDDPLALDECNDLANMLVVRTGHETERHWNDSAETFLLGVAATVVGYGERGSRSLHEVRQILSHADKLQLALQLMKESDKWGGLLSQLGGQLMNFNDKERQSVLSTALRHLRFLGTPAIAESTRTSSFDPADLRKGRMTVYLILPPDRANAQAGLLRMWIGSMLRACVRGGLQ